MACVREGFVYYVEETGYGDMTITIRIYKEGILQVDVDRGPTYRFYLERREVVEHSETRGC